MLMRDVDLLPDDLAGQHWFFISCLKSSKRHAGLLGPGVELVRVDDLLLHLDLGQRRVTSGSTSMFRSLAFCTRSN